ncbi:ATP-binding cassette domain-containing protein [Arthrobacter agilis]|uniref:sulfate/molybdate ABC transporter ATP-binding protein n=1 Tax=Arthrobacter agilis TaxID=37921 RepID=UPI000B34AE3D|nr:ATP-binding cassette domain-containing protein [Arthrobacter agilis]OUM44842.1 hypothetical protein B8W74_02890 [Arthrobacter agilis]PPB47166.1 molybdenum ABC transporter ATP-binding protein [Arthrobacter agilis]TPV22580.1 ATP-binding cassette domain-containing protein [Arthrobacter agilis]VDR32406.1 Sulfate/thiosulfate import ATP-binding protein CysA [Arthrobacter agilis]
MDFSFEATLPERHFDVAFALAHGQTLAVLGPNGAGKSTLLNLVAGLLAPSAGRATLGDGVLFDVGAGRRVLTEPRRRGVSLLAQEALLFPHLTALENVAFGPRSRGMPRAQAHATATTWLDRVGVAELAQRRPGRLSGGQAQRVAVARALAAEPSLLLLDEPLAALDVTVAPAVRALLRDVLAERTAIVVTHDPLDAFLLADHVLVLDGGRVVEAGPTGDVLTRPVTGFGARLAGLNLVRGRRTPAGFEGSNGLVVPWEGPHLPGDELGLAVRPAAVAVTRAAAGITPNGSRGSAGSWLDDDDDAVSGADGPHPIGASRLTARVDDVEHRGDVVRVHAAGMAADLAPADVVSLGILPGTEVVLVVRPEDVAIYPLPAPGPRDTGPGGAAVGR